VRKLAIADPKCYLTASSFCGESGRAPKATALVAQIVSQMHHLDTLPVDPADVQASMGAMDAANWNS
jgi:hypothetical protein